MNFPTRLPICTFIGLLLTLAFSLLFWRAWLNRYATPEQAFYLHAYIRSTIPIPKVQQYAVLEPHGILRLQLQASTMHDWLDKSIYDHGRALRLSLYGSGACLLIGLFAGAFLDGRRRRRLRAGVQTEGRRIISVEEFGARAGRQPFLIRVEED